MQNVGVVGLGSMGGGVVENLLKNRFSVYVYDIRPEVVKHYESMGAISCSSLLELGSSIEAVLTFLPMSPFDPTLEKALMGEDGLLKCMSKNSVVIECGNTSPQMAQKIAREGTKVGVHFLDAPVSGGPIGAATGTLSIMVGGEKEIYGKCLPVFEAIGKQTVYFGEAGMGQLSKLINNMLVANNLAALSEALVFATKAGLEPRKLLEAMKGGAANSWVLETYGEIILGRSEKGDITLGGGFSGIREGGRDKQLAWAMQMADDLDTPLPVTASSFNMFQMARGAGKSGICEPIVEMLEDLCGVTVIPSKTLKS